MDKDASIGETEIQVENYDEKRRKALAEIDNAEFGWFHVKTCMVAGVGFFTDAYDLFAINLVSSMLAYVYFGGKSDLPSNIDLGLKVSAQVGTFVGQFAFGFLADLLGRKKMYGVELMIIVVATVASTLAANGWAVSVQGIIIFWRLILGVGVGGDYPLSAVITSEYATTKRRGAMIAAVFAMQGFGILAAAIVATITLVAFKGAINDNTENIDYVWRIVLGVGAIPGLVALYFRLTIPETPRFTMDIERNIGQASKDITSVLQTGTYKERDDEDQIKVEAPKASFADFKEYFGKWQNFKVLLGTSITWFALDVAFYGVGLNNGIILEAVGFAGAPTPYKNLFNIAVGNIIIAALGTVPGYWVTVFTVDKLGRKKIQIGGFTILTILFLILGFGYDKIKHASTVLFVVIFTLAQFFMNFGPNATTFIVPGEVFPTRYRSTGHGISAAMGKLGAIVAQVGFAQLKNIGGKNAFVPHLLQIFAAFMFIGLLFSFLIPETKGISLEELSNENQTGFVKGLRNNNKATR